MSKINNIPDFELCKKLKQAGHPQPLSEFGQFWYTEPSGRLCVVMNNGMKAEDGRYVYIDHEPTSGFTYAPTVPEMMAAIIERQVLADGSGTFDVKFHPSNPNTFADDLANGLLWLIERRKEKDLQQIKNQFAGAAASFVENVTIEGGTKLSDEDAAEQQANFKMFGDIENDSWKKANPALIDEYHECVKTVYIPGVGDAYQEGPHTRIKSNGGGFVLPNTKVEDAVKLFESVKKFDANNPVPFYLTDEFKAKKEAEAQQKAEKERILSHWFEAGNVLLVCFGKRDTKVHEVLVLGTDQHVEYVKLQDKSGVSYWKKRAHIFINSLIANITKPMSDVEEYLVKDFLFPKNQPTSIITGTAGEKINAGDAVFFDGGEIFRSMGPLDTKS